MKFFFRTNFFNQGLFFISPIIYPARMLPFRKLLFIALPLSIIFFNSCSTTQESTKPTQIFRMNLHSEPSSIDPRLVGDVMTLTVGKMLFEGLTRASLQGEIVPALAEKIEISPDKKTYTFFLRNAHWSNGKPITAYDFEYAWKSVLSPQFPAEYAHQLFVIKNAEKAKKGELSLSEVGVEAIDCKKLVVILENPNPYFLELTSFPITYPICSEVAINNPAWAAFEGKDFICNGPFCLSTFRSGNELIANKNPHYWDADQVKLQSVILTMIADEHTELNMYENNELDWAGSPTSSIPPEALPSLKQTQNEELFITPVASTFCYKFNTKVAPFNSMKMRKAFSAAIDRNSLVNNILQAGQIVAKSLLPPCMRSNQNEEISLFSDACQKEAIAIFEEALNENGWSRENFPELTLIFSKSEKHQKVAQAIQQQWSHTFQIKVSLQSYEWNTFLDHLSKGDFQVGGRGWICDISDPKTLLELYKFATVGNNDTGWENQAFIDLITEAEETIDAEKRYSLLCQAEEILLNEMPVAPLYHSTACYLKKPYVKDVYMSKLCDLDLKNAYIQR